MLINILGSAAGGGFPQWNCNCRNCRDVRGGHGALRARTQSSLAISADRRAWLVLNTSPDIRQQIASTPALAPAPPDPKRSSPICSVLLTGAEVDEIAGLLSLRESHPLAIYATANVMQALSRSAIFEALPTHVVERITLEPDRPFVPAGCDGLLAEAFLVPDKPPLYLERNGAHSPNTGRAGHRVGLKVADRTTGRFVCYVPSCAAVDAGLCAHLTGAAAIFFDGTLYADDELVVQGLSPKTGRSMGHISMSGETGSIARLRGIEVGRRIFVHINNSNPVLREDSDERGLVEAAGWEVAYDGLELEL